MRLMRTPSVGWDRMSEHQRKEQIKNKKANSVKNVARAEFLSLCGLDPGKFKPRPLLTAWRTQVGPAATSGLRNSGHRGLLDHLVGRPAKVPRKFETGRARFVAANGSQAQREASRSQRFKSIFNCLSSAMC